MSAPSPLFEQLLDQASHLANREHKRTQQANLRRAVSSAYYALYHFLIGEASQSLLGQSSESLPLRLTLARAFNHRQMLEASQAFAAPHLEDKVLKGAIKGLEIPPDLFKIARTFKVLQEKRHEADYDLSGLLSKQDVLLLIEQVENGIAGWENVRSEPTARLYLTSLLFWDRMSKALR